MPTCAYHVLVLLLPPMDNRYESTSWHSDASDYGFVESENILDLELPSLCRVKFIEILEPKPRQVKTVLPEFSI